MVVTSQPLVRLCEQLAHGELLLSCETAWNDLLIASYLLAKIADFRSVYVRFGLVVVTRWR